MKTDEDFKLMWGVVYLPYRSAAYLYESVAMLFKLLLLMALVFFGPGTLYQLAAVLLVTFMRVGVHARWLPFADDVDNWLELCGVALSFLTAFGGVLLGSVSLAQENALLRTATNSKEYETTKRQYKKEIAMVGAGMDVMTLSVVAAYVFILGRELVRKRDAVRATCATASQVTDV